MGSSTDSRHMVVTLLTEPDTYLRAKARKRGLGREAVIVFLVGALASAGHAYVVTQLFEVVDPVGYGTFFAIAYVLEPLIAVIAFWIGAAMLTHFISRRFNARGRLSRVFKLSAWATLPVAVGAVVYSAVLVFAYRDVDPEAVDIEASAFDEQLAALQAIQMNEALEIVALLVLILSLLGVGYLLWRAIYIAKENLSEDDARTVAAVPVAIAILYLVYVLLRTMGLM